MKKFLIASGVAVLAFATVASAATFNVNLTVGSRGADVVALQAALKAAGFSIAAIDSGAAQPGYFGTQTLAAVKLYQASKGVPNTGFVGPLTRAALNGTVASVPSNCAAGWTSASYMGTAYCVPPGMQLPPGSQPTPPPAGTPLVMDGTDGSLTLSLSSYAGNNTIKKGETKDMVAVKLQATAGPVSVTRFDVRFNTRPWLYFSKVILKDSNGTVIATKNLSDSADATEITVGSDYLVRFDAINTVVTPGTDRTLVVSGSVLATTDKLTSDVSVIVSVPNSSIRTINGKGYTDSIGLGTVAQSGTTGRTMTLSSSGSTGNIIGRVSPSTPPTRIVNTSTNGETTGVVLGKFDFKSENRSSTINTLTFTLKDNSGNKPFSTMYKRVYITGDTKDGPRTVQVDSVATSSVFSNLSFDLPQDEYKTLTLTADIADQDDFTNGAMGSTTITVNTTNIVGIDSNFTTVTASGANAVTSNDFTFLQSGASISTPGATSNVNLVNNYPVTATIGFTFTFNNTGTSDLYIAKEANTALATTSTVGVAASSTVSSSQTVTSPSSLAGDSSTVWIIPSGTSRGFAYTGLIQGRGRGQGQNESTSITKVYFDDDTSGLQEFNINFGLEKLQTPSRFLEN